MIQAACARASPRSIASSFIGPGSNAHDLWQEALHANYGLWRMPRPTPNAFAAHVRFRDFGAIRFVECKCGSTTGERSPSTISQDGSPPFVGIQLTRSGTEHFVVGGSTVSANPQELILWNSWTPARFSVLGGLHKISLVFPEDALHALLPGLDQLRGVVLDATIGAGALLHTHINAIAEQLHGIAQADGDHIFRSLSELIAAAVYPRLCRPSHRLSHRYLQQLQSYIVQNLDDPSLCPQSIADAHGMSTRYVHMLFSAVGASVSNWIRDLRLNRCRNDLINPACAQRHIGSIAYDWGFQNASHFSKAFRHKYGMSPKDYRRAHARG